MHNAEFEITTHSLTTKYKRNPKEKKNLESTLLSEMDKQKSLVYTNFIEHLNDKNK